MGVRVSPPTPGGPSGRTRTEFSRGLRGTVPEHWPAPGRRDRRHLQSAFCSALESVRASSAGLPSEGQTACLTSCSTRWIGGLWSCACVAKPVPKVCAPVAFQWCRGWVQKSSDTWHGTAPMWASRRLSPGARGPGSGPEQDPKRAGGRARRQPGGGGTGLGGQLRPDLQESTRALDRPHPSAPAARPRQSRCQPSSRRPSELKAPARFDHLPHRRQTEEVHGLCPNPDNHSLHDGSRGRRRRGNSRFVASRAGVTASRRWSSRRRET
jgi:hypothetical protein